MNINSYEAKVIGEKRYKEIAEECNLFTKKWTYDRLKRFYKLVEEEMNSRKKLFSKKYKRNKKFKKLKNLFTKNVKH